MNIKSFSKKLDLIFWWLVWILPVIGGLLVVGFSSGHDFSSFITFIQNFNFPFITNIMTDFFDIVALQLPDVLLYLLSYIVSVELAHCLVDVLIFIPRICHKIVAIDEYTEKMIGGKK